MPTNILPEMRAQHGVPAQRKDSARRGPGVAGNAQCPHCKMSVMTTPSGLMIQHTAKGQVAAGFCPGGGKHARVR